MESARRCLVAVLARGTNSWQRNEGLAVLVDQIPVYRARRGNQGHYQEGTARPKQLYYKRCAEQLGANAACHAYMYKQKQKHISVCTLQRRTRSRRAVRAKGKPTRIELQWSSLFVTKA